MKIHQYNEMMRYLTRPPRLETSTSSPATNVLDTIIPDASNEQRETYAEGSMPERIMPERIMPERIIPKAISEEKQNMIQKINEYVNERLNEGEQVTTKDIKDEFGFKTKKDALIKEALGSEYEDKITKKEILNKETSLASKVNNQLGMGPSAMADVGEEVFTEAKGLYGKYAPQIAKGIGKGLNILATPAVNAALYTHDVISDLKEAAKEGSVTASKALDAFVGKGEKGLYFMLPQLAEDVVTNPIASKILQLGKLGRFANPLGATLSAVGMGKDVYDQYQEFKSLPPEQQEMFKQKYMYDGMTDELGNRIGAAAGGRIGYANGSEDEIPALSEERFFSDSAKELPKEGVNGIYYGAQDKPRVGYKDENFDIAASKNFNKFAGDTKPRYEASYTPNQNIGTFSINKGPGYLGAGYGREDLGNLSINKTPFTTEVGYNYDKDNLSYGIQGLLDIMGNKDIRAGIKYKF